MDPAVEEVRTGEEGAKRRKAGSNDGAVGFDMCPDELGCCLGVWIPAFAGYGFHALVEEIESYSGGDTAATFCRCQY